MLVLPTLHLHCAATHALLPPTHAGSARSSRGFCTHYDFRMPVRTRTAFAAILRLTLPPPAARYTDLRIVLHAHLPCAFSHWATPHCTRTAHAHVFIFTTPHTVGSAACRLPLRSVHYHALHTHTDTRYFVPHTYHTLHGHQSPTPGGCPTVMPQGGPYTHVAVEVALTYIHTLVRNPHWWSTVSP